ncbi:MAG: DUF2608 domain-containing protein [Xanthomonadales bacterium]
MTIRLNSIFTFSILLLILAACATTPQAETWLRETNSLVSVVEDAQESAKIHGTERVLVVFDIDNTLMAMEQGLGSGQWYDWQSHLRLADPCNARRVSDLLAVQGALYYISAMRPTQQDAAQLVRRLQDDGLKVIALTSRGPDFRLATFRELRRNGYSFFASAIGPGRGYPDVFVPAGGSRAARYEEGVFMTAGQHKGIMLRALLKKTDTPWPAVLVIVDDKERKLRDVLETFEDTGTAVHAWRYGREDGAVSSFDRDQATELWLQIRPALGQILTLLGRDNFYFPPSLVPAECALPVE